MSEWKEVRLDSICDVRDGTHDSPKQVLKGKPLITSRHIKNGKIDLYNTYNISLKDFNDVNRRSKVDKYDVLFSMIGTIAETALIDFEPDFAIKNVGLFKTNGDIDIAKWILYYFKSPFAKAEVEACLKGTTQQYITLGDLRKFPIKLPPLPEQKAIAGVLSSLDDKIDLLHRQNKTLEAMAETLFRQWFIEEAEDDWEEGKLGDFVNLVYGKSLTSATRTGKGYPVVGSNGIIDYHSEYLVKGPGIVIGRKGTLGKVIFLEDNFYPIDTTYYIHSLLQNSNLLFEYFLLKSIDFSQMNSDSAVPGLNKNIALSTEIIKPPIANIYAFNNIVSSFFLKIQSNLDELKIITQMRNMLLPKLMSGEVRVNM